MEMPNGRGLRGCRLDFGDILESCAVPRFQPENRNNIVASKFVIRSLHKDGMVRLLFTEAVWGGEHRVSIGSMELHKPRGLLGFYQHSAVILPRAVRGPG